MKKRFAFVVLLFIITLTQAQTGHYRTQHGIPLNDLTATPGIADPSMTTSKLCAKTFHTRDERNVTESEKRQVCVEYNQGVGCPGKTYEIDHLISLEIGGANGIENLWPQPAPAYHWKDVLENFLHKQVCSGAITLKKAQDCIAQNWLECANSFPAMKAKLTVEQRAAAVGSKQPK